MDVFLDGTGLSRHYYMNNRDPNLNLQPHLSPNSSSYLNSPIGTGSVVYQRQQPYHHHNHHHHRNSNSNPMNQQIQNVPQNQYFSNPYNNDISFQNQNPFYNPYLPSTHSPTQCLPSSQLQSTSPLNNNNNSNNNNNYLDNSSSYYSSKSNYYDDYSSAQINPSNSSHLMMDRSSAALSSVTASTTATMTTNSDQNTSYSTSNSRAQHRSQSQQFAASGKSYRLLHHVTT